MLTAKVLLLMFAVTGIAATGASGMYTETPPLTKAIEIHEDHLGSDSTLPAQAIKGQQNAYDHLMKNWEKWAIKNHTWMFGEYD